MKKQEVEININISVIDPRNSNGKPSNITSADASKTEKIKSNLSVSQLAYFCRLMYESGAIVPKSQTDILKFITDNFHTVNTQEISIRSLRSRYYTVDLATKEAIKALLNKMIKAIDQY